ncbi:MULTISPECIES: VOC family protein [Bacillaceae]|uniref:VOC family protein n=1 Tax=Evansella alkalicola TaxID=745819 RepID=A0ABS6JW60_9BACI|nr:MULTISPECIES: VOC family protein [Bacillaceae]MBU9722733.1 VOC family protein [Bacillus alkalicola]
MFERIDTICLTVSNVEKSSVWYEELGFKVTFQGEGYRVLSVGKSEVPLTIEEGSKGSNKDLRKTVSMDSSKAKSIAYHENQAYPIFFTRDIEGTYKKLRNKGVEVTEIRDDGDNKYFDFYDLDHNKLQVCFWE